MELVEKGPIKYVGMQVTAAWDDLAAEMPLAWRTFIGLYDTISARASDTFTDVSLRQENETYTQLVAVEVDQIIDVPDGMVGIELPRQTYIHHRHTGPVDAIAATFGEMIDWAAQEGHTVSALKIDAGYTPGGTETGHDLYIGLV